MSVRYPRASKPIIRACNLTVGSGEVLGLSGRSGSGKSTVLGAISGLIPWMTPAGVEGDIIIGGERLNELDPGQRAHHLSTCLDRPESQLFLATVAQEIDAARRLSGETGVVDELLEALGVGPLLERRITELSSGERQRVALAVALAGCPRPVLLDEPTAHLDSGGVRELSALITELASRGASMLVAEQAGWRLDEAVGRWSELSAGRFEPTEAPSAPRVTPPGNDPGERVVLACRELAVARNDRMLIRGIDLDLHEGEIVLLSGPNGSGKSTLALVLAGLAAAAEGELSCRGRRTLMLPDATLQLFASSVAEEVSVARARFEERARVLRRHRLEHLAARAPWTLSRGEQQRLVHAALDLLRPEVMIVDEPTQGLDGADLAVFLELIRRRAAKGRAYLVISHRPEIEAIAHRRFAVRDGRLEEDGE